MTVRSLVHDDFMGEATSERETEGTDSDTRTRLLDAAIHVASTDGLDKVTYRSVAAQAGLSHSLVRFYFGTGSQMIDEALERAAQLDVQEARLNSESIEDFGRDLVNVVSGERSQGMLQYDYLLRAVRGGVPMERVRSLYMFHLDEVRATLDTIGIDDADGSISALVFAAIDGLVLQHAIYQSEERTELVMEKIREVLRLLQRTQDLPPH